VNESNSWRPTFIKWCYTNCVYTTLFITDWCESFCRQTSRRHLLQWLVAGITCCLSTKRRTQCAVNEHLMLSLYTSCDSCPKHLSTFLIFISKSVCQKLTDFSLCVEKSKKVIFNNATNRLRTSHYLRYLRIKRRNTRLSLSLGYQHHHYPRYE